MKLEIDWAIDDATWRTLLAASPGATFFHTPGWYRARAAALGMRVGTAHLAYEDGSHALLPFAVRPLYRGLVRGAIAGLENGYGGLLSPSPLTDDQLSAAYQAIAARFGDLEVTGNPFAPAAPMPAIGEARPEATQVLSILPPEEQLAMMAGMRVRHVRKGRRAGFRLEVRHGLTPDDAQTFLALYQAHAARWRYTRWVRDGAYFRSLLHSAGEDMALFLAYQDQTLAGFHLVGMTGAIAIQLNMATNEAFDKANVGTWLIAESLAWLHARGLQQFDFLASGQLEGVRAYKASFGAQPRHYEVRRKLHWLGRTLKQLKPAPAWAPGT